MSQQERIVRIDSVSEQSDGRFGMTLATEGEATDGDILSIEGGEIPERMPLQNSHINDARETLGSVIEPVKNLKAKPPTLRATGQIEMDGPLATIRQDLDHMIKKGHIDAVSIRWWPIESIARVNLPSDHPAFVDFEKSKWPERYGLFYPKWRALEGSIVAVGADPKALMKHALGCEGRARSYWRSMAVEAAVSKEGPDTLRSIEAARRRAPEIFESFEDPDADHVAERLSEIARLCRALCKEDVDTTSIFNALDVDPSEKVAPIELCGRMFHLPLDVVDQLQIDGDARAQDDELEEKSADQPTRIDWKLVGEMIADATRSESRIIIKEIRSEVDKMIHRACGGVQNDG